MLPCEWDSLFSGVPNGTRSSDVSHSMRHVKTSFGSISIHTGSVSHHMHSFYSVLLHKRSIPFLEIYRNHKCTLSMLVHFIQNQITQKAHGCASLYRHSKVFESYDIMLSDEWLSLIGRSSFFWMLHPVQYISALLCNGAPTLVESSSSIL